MLDSLTAETLARMQFAFTISFARHGGQPSLR